MASLGAITSYITPCNILKFSSQGHGNTSPTHSADPTHPTQPTYPTHSTQPVHSTHPTHFISPTDSPYWPYSLIFTIYSIIQLHYPTHSTHLTHLAQPSSSAHVTLSFK